MKKSSSITNARRANLTAIRSIHFFSFAFRRNRGREKQTQYSQRRNAPSLLLLPFPLCFLSFFLSSFSFLLPIDAKNVYVSLIASGERSKGGFSSFGLPMSRIRASNERTILLAASRLLVEQLNLRSSFPLLPPTLRERCSSVTRWVARTTSELSCPTARTFDALLSFPPSRAGRAGRSHQNRPQRTS